MTTIAIRADANENIGMGHVMRCISIAEGIKLQGHNVLFIIKENVKAISVLNKYDMEYVVLENFDYESITLDNQTPKEKELNIICDILRENSISNILVDAYDVTEKYFQDLHKHFKVAYLDDLNKFRYDVDLVINYSFGVKRDIYLNYDNATDFMLGSDYVPIRQSFVQCKREKTNDSVQNIMLTTGGTDSKCLIEKFIQQWNFEKYSGINLHIVVGQYFTNKEKLNGLCEKHNQIHLYEGVTDLSKLMSKCDIAMSAGGTTVWELATVGVVTMAVAFVENQRGVLELEKAGIVSKAFDFINEDPAMKSVVGEMEKLISDIDYRRKIFINAQRCADGKGSWRVGKQLIEM